MKSVGEILTWGVPEFLPVKFTDMEIWELEVPNTGVSGFNGLLLTRDSATGTPMLQLIPGSNITLKIELFALLHLDSTLSELETRISDIFGSGRVLDSETQNLSDCSPGARLINSVNIWTAPQTSLLLTQLTCDFDGSGILCAPRQCRFNVKAYVNSGGIVKANPKNVMGVTRQFNQIN